jgi:riboflavin synthase
VFTGLVQGMAEIISIKEQAQCRRLIINGELGTIQAGESIAVNGVCLSTLHDSSNEFSCDISPETFTVTTLSDLKVGDKVNIEKAMSVNEKFGGHYVTGHIDTIATITALEKSLDFTRVKVSNFGIDANAYLISKGSICLDGVSLTINNSDSNTIELMIIPHTLKYTTLANWTIGQKVNVEFDYFIRVIAHQINLFKKEVMT